MTPQGTGFKHLWHKAKAVNTSSEPPHSSYKPHMIPFALTWSACFVVTTPSFPLGFSHLVHYSLFTLYTKEAFHRKSGFADHGLVMRWCDDSWMVCTLWGSSASSPWLRKNWRWSAWGHFPTSRKASHNFQWKIAHLPGSPASVLHRFPVGYKINTFRYMPLYFLNRKNEDSVRFKLTELSKVYWLVFRLLDDCETEEKL